MKSNIKDRQPFSVVIIAKNEAHRIESCLESVAWADEIIVIDSGSSDDTCSIARKFTDRVFNVDWRGFGPQKQAGVDLATNDWIFSIDCDEHMTPELAIEINSILSGDNLAPAYTVPRRTFIGNNEVKHCGWYPDRTVRLFNRQMARFSDSLVHEHVLVSGPTKACTHHLLHYSFNGFSDMIAKMNLYTDLGAEQLVAKGLRPSLLQVTIRPLFTFFKTYVIKLGFLDGFTGYMVSASNAISVFAKYAKLRERCKRPSFHP